LHLHSSCEQGRVVYQKDSGEVGVGEIGLALRRPRVCLNCARS
jgi:hypothetical protein